MSDRVSLLIVDDIAANRTVMEALLRREFPGCEIASASNGADGLALASERSVDGALIDLQMPGMDGIELCERLKADPRTSRTSVILFTSQDTTPALRSRGLDAGADDFIQRPCDNYEFLARVKVMLRLKATEDELRRTNVRLTDLVEERTAEVHRAMAWFRTLFEGAPMAISACDLEGNLVAANSEAVRLYGYPDTRSLLELSVRDVIAPKDHDRVTANLRRLLDLGRLRAEYTSRRLDGSTFPSVITSAVMSSESEAPDRIIVVIEDLTKPQRAGRRKELYAQVLTELNAMGHDDRALGRIARAIRSIGGFDAAGFRLADGDDYPFVACAGYPDSFPATDQTLHVTDGAGNALQDERGRALLSCLCGAVIRRTLDPDLATYSERGSFWSNHLQHDMAALSEATSPSALIPRERCHASGYESIALIPLMDGEATLGLLHVASRAPDRISPRDIRLLEDLGVAIGVALGKRSASEQLLQSQKLESMGRLTGGIAHDFNNLLTVILSNASNLADEFEGNTETAADIESIRTASVSAAKLIRQLLAFSRKQPLIQEVVVFDDIPSHLEGMLGRVLGEDIELVVVAGAGGARVKLDPNLWEQVLVNLVVNARDAMPEGGKLTVSTQRMDRADSEIASSGLPPTADYLKLSVADEGHGMDRLTMARIFEPFYTTRETGTGLGLSTVYGIVRQSGGRMSVSSEPGQGTTFDIYLPLTEEVGAAPARERRAAPRAQGHETILLVEDEPQILKVLSRGLGKLGYEVIGASSGEEAIAAAEAHDGPIQLAISDLVMPGINGWTTIGLLAESRPRTRFMLMSGYLEHASDQRPAAAGDVTVLHKPFEWRALAATVRDILDETSGSTGD